MPERNLWQSISFFPPIQYLIASIDYLFDGHMMAAKALIYLYLITVATRMVAESRRYFIDQGCNDPKSYDVIYAIVTLSAWRSGYLSLDTFCNKFLQRFWVWIVILLTARVMHSAYPEQGWTKGAVGMLLAFELRSITGNLGDCGLERARMIRQFIDQAIEAILKAKIQDLGRALMGLGGALFGWGNYQPSSKSMDRDQNNSNGDGRNGPKDY